MYELCDYLYEDHAATGVGNNLATLLHLFCHPPPPGSMLVPCLMRCSLAQSFPNMPTLSLWGKRGGKRCLIISVYRLFSRFHPDIARQRRDSAGQDFVGTCGKHVQLIAAAELAAQPEPARRWHLSGCCRREATHATPVGKTHTTCTTR